MNAKGVGQSNISFERVFFVLLRSGTLHEPMAASHVLTFASTHLRLPHQWHCASFERAKRALLMNIDQNSGPVGQLSIHEDFQAPRSGASLWHLSVHRVLCEAPEKTDAKARAASIPRGLGTECMLRQNAKMHIRSGARASGCISRLLSGAPAQCLPITLNSLRSVLASLATEMIATCSACSSQTGTRRALWQQATRWRTHRGDSPPSIPAGRDPGEDIRDLCTAPLGLAIRTITHEPHQTALATELALARSAQRLQCTGRAWSFGCKQCVSLAY